MRASGKWMNALERDQCRGGVSFVVKFPCVDVGREPLEKRQEDTENNNNNKNEIEGLARIERVSL